MSQLIQHKWMDEVPALPSILAAALRMSTTSSRLYISANARGADPSWGRNKQLKIRPSEWERVEETSTTLE
jgi:hypothetical protein